MSPAGLEAPAAKGALAVAVAGLPAGGQAQVQITGPGGFARQLTSSEVLQNLVPGSYTLSAANVSAEGHTWSPSPAAQDLAVVAGGETTTTVQYGISTGALTITVNGLPVATPAALTLTGPAGFSQSITGTTTLTGLAPGTYALGGAVVTSGSAQYAPAVPAVPAIAAGLAATVVTVTYVPQPSGEGGSALNLRIDGLYVTQAAQRYDGTVPLVAGRAGYLRVFVLANQANTAMPQVRVRLFNGGSLRQTWTLDAPGPGVPLAVNEGSLAASWNVLIPAPLMQPGLAIQADVDPAAAVAEADESDNTFPAGGIPAPVDVRALTAWNVRFVPVLQSANGLAGNVTSGNASAFLSSLLQLFPVGGHDADVRAPYTTTAPALASDNANGAWGTILSEVLALKAADASTRYYYGVVKTGYSSGIAGMGYVGGGARTAIGWDRMPSAAGVMAHEVGHNMGRTHAACGGAGGPDASYPHQGGSIGIWGLDVASLQLKDPATYYDLMGYCNPDWVSDYNWSAMLEYRQVGPSHSIGRSVGPSVGQGLLVWGRITASGLVLEPAFVVDKADLAPPAPGPHLIEARDADGRVIFSIPFAAHEATDLPTGREEAFAFVVPAARARAADIAELRLAGGGRSVTRLSASPAVPRPVFVRGADARGLLQWDAALHPMVMIRDPASGQILSFARGGSVRLPPGVTRIDATFSGGTRNSRLLLDRRTD